jgi:hypothetical protein
MEINFVSRPFRATLKGESIPKKSTVVTAGLTTFAIVAYLDYVTPEYVNCPIFYLIPIGIYCWYFGWAAAAIISIASAATWPLFHWYSGAHPSFFEYWNGVVSLGFYAIFVATVSAIKNHIKHENKINAELSKALSEVKELKGLLPICSSCKKIRDEQGEWHVLEGYIQRRTDATFSHGVCPECLQRLYPELVQMGDT